MVLDKWALYEVLNAEERIPIVEDNVVLSGNFRRDVFRNPSKTFHYFSLLTIFSHNPLNLGSSPVQTKSQEADDVDSYGSQMAQLAMERDAAYQERDAAF